MDKRTGGDVMRTNAPRESFLLLHNNAQNLNIAAALDAMIDKLDGSVSITTIRELKVIRDAASHIHEQG